MERYMDAEARFLHADMLIERGEIAEAKAILEEIISDEPGYGRAHNHLGWIIRTSFSDFERAAYHLRLAVKFAPDYPGGYLNYARLLMEVGEFEKMEEVALKALEVKGIDRAWAIFYLAVARERTAGPAEGLKALKVARDAALDEGTFKFISGEMKRVKGKLNPIGRIAMLF